MQCKQMQESPLQSDRTVLPGRAHPLSAQLRVFLLQLFLIVVEGKVGLQDSELESTDRIWTFGDNSNDRLCWRTHASRAVFVSSARITGIEFSALPNREPISPST